MKDQLNKRQKFLAEEETEVDESYFGPSRVKGKRGRGTGKKIAVVGLLEKSGKVFTKPVDRCTKDELLHVILERVAGGVDIYTDGWKSYDALAVYGFNHGIRKTHFDLYLKETEWRFNHSDKVLSELRKLIRDDRAF